MSAEDTLLLGASPPDHAVVTNIYQLMDVLAFGWEKGPRDRRFLLASDWGGQFVRLPGQSPHHFYERERLDIPVETGGYRMQGFIRFEAHSVLPGLIETSKADDVVWYSANLTQQGYAAVRAGLVIDLVHRDIKASPFWNPPASPVDRDLELGHRPLSIAHANGSTR